MSFPAPKFTDVGKQIQLKAIAGEKLKISRISIGSGSAKNIDISKLTGLIHEEHSFTTQTKLKKGNIVEIIATFNNEEVQTAFNFREIGVFAEDPESHLEVLYCYTNCGDTAEKIEPTSVSYIEKTIRVPINVGDAENIEITIEQGTYITRAEFNEATTPVTGSYSGTEANGKLEHWTNMDTGREYWSNHWFRELGFKPKLVIIQDNAGRQYIITPNGIITNNFDKFGNEDVYATFTETGFSMIYRAPTTGGEPGSVNIAAGYDINYFYTIFR